MGNNSDEVTLMKLDNLIWENLVMLEKTSKMKAVNVVGPGLVKMVNPYYRQNRSKDVPEVEILEENTRVYSPCDRFPKAAAIEVVKPISEVARSNWLTPQRVAEQYSDLLTHYEQSEIFSYSRVYFIGSKAAAQKRTGAFSIGSNYGYDDAEGSYLHVTHDHIAYRYEILRELGRGSFGQVLKVFDHKTKQFAALKIVRNEKRFLHQAKKEVKILEHILNEDLDNSSNVVHILDSFMFRGHACIVFELMSINMYELIKKNKFLGFTVKLVRNFAHSILIALNLLYKKKIIHGDLKPENILLKQPGKSGIKVIDFGSSVYEGSKLYTYVQSRFYRAPEVILGNKYDCSIDMWSLGCILAELLMGIPILPGEDEEDQLAMTIELLGMPPSHIIRESKRCLKFFSSSGNPRYCRITDDEGVVMMEGGKSRRGKIRGPPGSKNLAVTLKCLGSEEGNLVVDFIRRCLEWDPKLRMTPELALRHAWLSKREFER